MKFKGANLVGGDNLWSNWNPSTGPIDGHDYLFVGPADVDRLVAKGMNFFRVVFGCESIKPQPNAPIPGSGNFGIYFARFKALVDYVTNVKKCVVIIDVHGGSDSTFARYFGKLVGSEVPTSIFVNLWSQLASIFKSNMRVIFGITNEPTRMPTLQWFGIAQQVLNGIRPRSANIIAMPGNYFTGAGSWTSTSDYDTSSPKLSNGYGWDNARGTNQALYDPFNRTAVQVHLYLDPDASGTSDVIQSSTIGVERLDVVVQWARARRLFVVIGEVAVSASSPLAASAWRNLMNYIDANKDVIIGWCWWAYGDPTWWGGYRFALVDGAGQETAQMKLIEKDLA